MVLLVGRVQRINIIIFNETMAQQTNHLFDRAEVSFVHEGPTTLHVQQGGLVRLHVVINQTHVSYSSILFV
jgi:hypothetical protein